MDEKVHLKIEYLKELRAIFESDQLNEQGKDPFLHMIHDTCFSIQTDLSIAMSTKPQQLG